MKNDIYRQIFLFGLILILFFTPIVSGERVEIFYETYELEEGYYVPVNIDGLDYDYEIVISSSSKIDAVILTDTEYNNCCSGDETSEISFTDQRSHLSTISFSTIIPSLEDGYILIIDNSDAVTGGENASQNVVLELYYYEISEEIDYSFNFFGFLSGIILIPLVILAGIDLFRKYGWTEKTLELKYFKQIISKFEEYKHKEEGNFFMSYPVLTVFIITNILWYILGYITGQYHGEENQYEKWINLGATNIFEILQGNLISLITANFMHFDFEHLISNLVPIFFIGFYVEKELGSAKFITFIFFTGLCSSILGLFELSTGGGASGVALALIGMVTGQIIFEKVNNIDDYCTYPNMKWFWYSCIAQAVPFVIWITTSGGSDGVSHWGHLGGFLSGIAFGFFVINPRYEMNRINYYENMTVVTLKEILKEMKLPTSGNKSILIERLIQSENSINPQSKENDLDNLNKDLKEILFSFEGRINRQIWWYSTILVHLVYGLFILFVENIILKSFLEIGFVLSFLTLIIYLPYYYMNIALIIKRLKDTNRGWEWGFLSISTSIISGLSIFWGSINFDELTNLGFMMMMIILLFIYSIFNLTLIVICGFYKGTEGSNKYGNNPLKSTEENINSTLEIDNIVENSNKLKIKEKFSLILDSLSDKKRELTKKWKEYNLNKENDDQDETEELTDFEKWVSKYILPLIPISIFIFALLIIIGSAI